MAVITNNIRWADNTAELKANLLQGIGTIDAMKASVDRTTASLGGAGLFAAANKLTAAIDQLGGSTKLTAAEQDRANATLDKAIEKYQAMGMTVPPMMQQLADSMKKPHDGLESLGDAIKSGIEDPIGSAKAAVGALADAMGPLAVASVGVAGVLAAVGAAAYELTSKAAETGEGFYDMSLKTGMSVVAASQLSGAMKIAGGDAETLSNAVFMMEKRLDDSGAAGDKARGAIQTLGISIEAFQAMTPDEKILALSQGFRDLDPSISKATTVFDIFGRQGRDILPTLLKPLDDLVERSKDLGTTWTEDDAKAAEEFEMSVRSVKLGIDTLVVSFGKDLIPAAQSLVTLLGDLSSAWSKLPAWMTPVRAGIAVIGEVSGVASATIGVLSGSIDKLPTVSGDATKGVTALAAATKAYATSPLANALGVQTEAMGDLNRSYQTVHQQAVQAAKDAEQNRVAADNVRIATAGYAGVLNDLDGGLIANIQSELAHGAKVEDVAREYGVAKGSVQQIENELKFLQSVTSDTTKVFGNFVAVVPDLGEYADDTQERLHNLSASVNEFHDGISIAGDTVATVTIPMFSTLAAGVLPQMTGAIKDATKETASFADELSGSLDQALQQMPNMLAKAFTGSGGLEKAAESLGSKFGEDLGKNILGKAGEGGVADTLTNEFGDAIGGALGAAVPVVGGLLGPLIGKLFSIGGPSAAELAGRKTEAAFEQGFGGFAGMMATVGTAYTTAGLSAQQAQSDVQNLLNAEKQGTAATQAAIDTINANIALGAAKVSTGVQNILDAAKTVGTNFPAAMGPMITSLLSLPGLTDAEKTSLEGLATAGQPSFADLSAAAGRYGLSLDSIGGKAAQLSISTQADQIITDYKNLVTTSGADSDKVLAGMSGSLNTLVQHAMDAGDVLPTALEPLVKQLFDTGQLTDDAGQKITDFSKLKFDDTGDPLATGIASLTDSINNLVKILTNDLPGAAKTAADGIAANLSKGVNVPLNFVKADDGGSAAGMASGGLVTDHGIQYFGGGGNVVSFTPRGSDTVPAMLTPGEMVLTRRQQSALFHGGNSGGDVNHTTIVNIDGQQVYRAVEKIQTRQLQTRRKLAAA